ncbi:MAG: DUF6249 domain-containing protein [Gammaproteobacteria bacterium]|nr:DUF6249 domain-containing protein [Gammaproteobacteria bacterium]
MDDFMAGIVGFAAVVFIFGPVIVIPVAWFYFKFKKDREIQNTLRTALEKGHEVPAELLEQISDPKVQPKKDQDLRRGIVLVAVGLGIGAFGYLVGEDDAFGPLAGIGSIPLLIGLGLTLLWVLRSRHDK